MNIRSSITDYYFARSHELSLEKRFHFGSRLLAWADDPRARKLLAQTREHIVPDNPTNTTLEASFKSLAASLPDSHMPGLALRRPYFERFPTLFGSHQALFRLRHLRFVYGIDGQQAFERVVGQTELRELERRLLADPDAIRTLSTYAINFLYLLRRIVLNDDTGIDVEQLYRLGNHSATNDPEQNRLLIYLYTHCIVAESNFYTRKLPENLLPTYQKMLEHLETIIAEHFTDASLDTKLEFLVCCRIAGHDTTLKDRIEDECSRSLSPDGTFIIDTHNSFADRQEKRSFENSEHRNVLFIMGGSKYAPHSTLVG